jgi:hypothetical protein
MVCGFNEIGPCPGRCGVTGGGRLPLVVIHCGAPGDLAVLVSFGQVAPQMPPVGDLDGQRRALGLCLRHSIRRGPGR